MGIQEWTWVTVGVTFAAYLYIGYRSRVASTRGFYVAGQGVPAIANGAATAADWMSAASFISMAGLIAFQGFDGSVYLMGWTGGYVLLALLLAPFLRRFGQFTVPDFVAARFDSKAARLVAAIAALFVSLTYVAGQMGGVGVAFGRFLQVPFEVGVVIGMVIVAFFAGLGGMKGSTYTQVAQYCVRIFAYSVPAIALGLTLFGNPVPQVALSDALPILDQIQMDLGLDPYSSPFVNNDALNVFCITLCLMVGTAGLPHVIVRFYTVKSVRAARWSAFWAILFIGILYTTAPAIAVFAKTAVLQQFVELGPQGCVAQVAVVLAGLLGIFPLGFVAEVVAFAFGLAAASFFPTIVLGIFWKRANRQGAVAGMAAGLAFTFVMIVLMRAHVVAPGVFGDAPVLESFLGIKAQGIGVVGMLINFGLTVAVSLATPPPPEHVRQLVGSVRSPRG